MKQFFKKLCRWGVITGCVIIAVSYVLNPVALGRDQTMPGMDHSPMMHAASDESFFANFFKVYTPRQMCMFYETSVIWLHIISDFTIAVAYFSIPFALVYFVRNRKDVVFGVVFWLFAAFILACGTTHFIGVLDIWKPYYKLDGVVKAITAALSIVTAVALWKLMPQFLAIPSPAMLEIEVADRTAELEQINTQLLLATASKAQAYAHLQAVVDRIVEGLLSCDSLGTIIECNSAASEMHGFARSDQSGKKLADLPATFRLRTLEGHDVPLDQWPISRALRGETFSNLELVMHLKEKNEDRYISFNGTGVRDPDGNISLAVISLHDITDRKRAENEREALLEGERAARNEAERANRLKDEFLATLSHELRTPLNAILGWSQILHESYKHDAELDEGLSVIERNARAQTKLISDLLDMSRIMSGKLKLEIVPIDFSGLVNDVIASVLPSAEAKNITLTRITPQKRMIIRGDANRLQQVIWNILTNAIKFTAPGGKVEVSMADTDGATVSVADNGPGIAPEFLPHVFERFRQFDGSTTRQHGGLGIGLSIVKNIVEAHGGSVNVSSPGLGHGTRFSVTLPMTRGELTDASHGTERQRVTGELKGLKVLVVDDDPDALALIARVLRDAKATVVTAHSAAEAMPLLERDRFNALISDIGMPDEDGYQFIRKIRRLDDPSVANIAAVAVTAFVSAEDQKRAIDAGFQTHLGKPADAVELVTTLAALVST